jgi:succinate dehydrogenase / fumarate reductase membrane anchor subunit
MTAPTLPEGGFRTGVDYTPRERQEESERRAFAWVLVRLTGLILTVLVLGHFSLTHIFTDVADTGAGFVARRWSSALWLIWDWLLLAAAISHGAAGVWVALDDYTPDRVRRARRQRVLIGLSAVILALGTVTIVVVGVR